MAADTKDQALDLVAAIFVRAGERALRGVNTIKASSPSARTPADGPPDINESESLSNVDITELEQPDINPRADRHVPTDVGDVDVPSASVAGDTEQVAA